jgi:hypothetical protein
MKASLLSAALLCLGGEAAACGYCVEDKIAATYDHAVVTRALQRGQHLAFFHVDGPEPRPEATRRALEHAASMPGVDKASVRISADLLTLSLAFDPRHVPLAAIVERLDRRLSARKLSVLPLRIMERPADLTSVKR